MWDGQNIDDLLDYMRAANDCLEVARSQGLLAELKEEPTEEGSDD